MPKIINDRQVQHRNGTMGTVIYRVVTLEIDGVRFERRHWCDWHVTGGPDVRVDTVRVGA